MGKIKTFKEFVAENLNEDGFSYYLTAASGKTEIKPISRYARQNIDGINRFKTKDEAQKEADKRNNKKK